MLLLIVGIIDCACEYSSQEDLFLNIPAINIYKSLISIWQKLHI